jgi:putative ABC transport system permease protein
VVRLFLFESLLLGLFAAFAGSVIGPTIAALINAAEIHVPLSVQLFLMTDTLRLHIAPEAVFSTLVLISSVTAGAALYPALRAARLRPIDAMAHFG